MPHTLSTPALAQPRWAQFYALTKPRVVQLIVFCALIGMLLAEPGWPDCALAVPAVLGIWLVAARGRGVQLPGRAAASTRRWRAPPGGPRRKGELTNTQTLAFAAVLCALGSAVLYAWVNPLTMWLTFATFVGYAVVYTVVLKPLTPQNIVIGGASGAMPPVLGWAAMTRRRRRRGADAVPDHLPVDAAALLGAGAVPRRGLPQGRPADAADHPRPRVHAAAGAAVHDRAVRRHAAAVRLRHERLALPGRGRRAGRRVHAATRSRCGARYSDALARRTFRFSIWHLSLLFAALLLDHYLLPWPF